MNLPTGQNLSTRIKEAKDKGFLLFWSFEFCRSAQMPNRHLMINENCCVVNKDNNLWGSMGMKLPLEQEALELYMLMKYESEGI